MFLINMEIGTGLIRRQEPSLFSISGNAEALQAIMNFPYTVMPGATFFPILSISLPGVSGKQKMPLYQTSSNRLKYGHNII